MFARLMNNRKKIITFLLIGILPNWLVKETLAQPSTSEPKNQSTKVEIEVPSGPLLNTIEPRSLLQQAIDRSQRNEKSDSRITNGKDAFIAGNPWQAALVWSGGTDNLLNKFCGASIISAEWVITAAHCIDKRLPATSIEVLSGTHSLQPCNPEIIVSKGGVPKQCGVRSKVKYYRVHPDYQRKQYGITFINENDVALLKIDLNGPKLSGNTISGWTDSLGEIAEGATLLVTGWGVTERKYQPTSILQQIDIPYVSNQTCNSPRSYGGSVTDKMLCAGDLMGKKNPCYGDSGGPATIEIGGVRKLVGIVSWGIDCQTPYLYSVFTRVSQYRDWIIQETSGAISW
jgi:secreted trypsin-like serine protease